MNTPEQLDAVAAGRLDGGFCYRFGALPEGITSIPVLEQNVVLAVPDAWPLGSADSVVASELIGKAFIAFPFKGCFPLRSDVRIYDIPSFRKNHQK